MINDFGSCLLIPGHARMWERHIAMYVCTYVYTIIYISVRITVSFHIRSHTFVNVGHLKNFHIARLMQLLMFVHFNPHGAFVCRTRTFWFWWRLWWYDHAVWVWAIVVIQSHFHIQLNLILWQLILTCVCYLIYTNAHIRATYTHI